MADLADVEASLVSLIQTAVYPNGTSAPSAIVLSNSRVPDVRIFAGWPDPDRLDADIFAGTPIGSAAVINISVYCQPGLERNVTRYPREWVDQALVSPTILAAASGSTVTLSGTITAGHYVSVIVFNNAFSYACVVSDTLATVATALAALINARMPAFAIGAVITIIGRSDIIARTAAPGTVIQELERTNQRFQVTIWAPNNDSRQATARIVRPALALPSFLNLADTSQGRIIYEASNDIDRTGKQSISCRDIYYWVEYPTTQVMPGYPITIPVEQITGTIGTLSGPAGPTYVNPVTSFPPVGQSQPTFYLLGF